MEFYKINLFITPILIKPHNIHISKCNTPVLTPFALNVYDVYIVINCGVELKAKSPTIDLVVLCLVIEIVADGIS